MKKIAAVLAIMIGSLAATAYAQTASRGGSRGESQVQQETDKKKEARKAETSTADPSRRPTELGEKYRDPKKSRTMQF